VIVEVDMDSLTLKIGNQDIGYALPDSFHGLPFEERERLLMAAFAVILNAVEGGFPIESKVP
jgi:hypothetical protein